MNQLNAYSDAHLEQRILQRFSEFTGKPIEEIDPALRLLVHWQASELAKLHLSMQDKMESNTIRHLTERLLPGIAHAPRPACTILQINPSEQSLIINPEHAFTLQGKADLWNLSPITTTNILPASLQYIVHQGKLFETNSVFNQSFVAAVPTKNEEVWFGIKALSETRLDQFVLFINGHSGESHYSWHDLLKNAQYCTTNGHVLVGKAGVPDQAHRGNLPMTPNFMLENEIINWCNGYFLQLRTEGNQILNLYTEKTPEFLINTQFSEDHKKNTTEGMIWIKAILPFHPTSTDIATLQVALNCVPVLNRKKMVLFSRVSDTTNLSIPLRKSNENQNEYDQKACFYSMENVKIGDHLLSSASARQNSMDDCYVLEYGKFEKKYDPEYLIHVRHKQTKQQLRISYWATSINLVEDLPMGAEFEFLPNDDFSNGFNNHVKIENARTIIPTWGQMNKPDEEQCRSYLHLLAWQGLASVPTRSYLRSMAYARLGKNLDGVQFRPTWLSEPFPAKGVRRILEMLLIPSGVQDKAINWPLESELIQQIILDLLGISSDIIRVNYLKPLL